MEIQLTKGYTALVDADDFEWLSLFNWCVSTYRRSAIVHAVTRLNPSSMISMHRLIMNPEPRMEVDHIDRNGLNNQKDNLRFATRSQNTQNRPKQFGGSSRYKGVCWDKRTGKWMASIAIDGNHFALGRFASEDEAASVYNENALSLFGEFAYLNIIGEQPHAD